MHEATPHFWDRLNRLPRNIQDSAHKAFALLKENPRHPSLHFKKVNKYWSVRVGGSYRALAIKHGDRFVWVWIGSHDEYQKIIKRH